MYTYEDAATALKLVSDKLRRQYACACFRHVAKVAQSHRVVEAVLYVHDNIDNLDLAMLDAHNRVCQSAQANAARTTMTDKLYQIEAARELAVCCTMPSSYSHATITDDLTSAIWAIRGFLHAEFDREILEDLGIIDHDWSAVPDYIIPANVKAMAHVIYESQDYEGAGPLSDAVEEAGLPQEWAEHLRKPIAHVKGCWVIDYINGMGCKNGDTAHRFAR